MDSRLTTNDHSMQLAIRSYPRQQVAGGDGNVGDETYLSRVEILDTTEQRRWYNAPSLPHALHSALPATVGNMLYLLGAMATLRE